MTVHFNLFTHNPATVRHPGDATQRFLTGWRVEPGGRWQARPAASGSVKTETRLTKRRLLFQVSSHQQTGSHQHEGSSEKLTFDC